MPLIPLLCHLMLAMSLLASVARAATDEREHLPAVRVNGVRIDITRLVDRDLAARLRLIEAEWRVSGSEMQPWRDVGTWRVLAHRDGRWSETLQVRREGRPSEAWLSRLDLSQSPGSVPRLTLPPGCRADSTVESGEILEQVVQVTGPCRALREVDMAAWTSRLVAQEWRGGRVGSSSLWRFQRGAEALQVVRHASSFTALRALSQRRSP